MGEEKRTGAGIEGNGEKDTKIRVWRGSGRFVLSFVCILRGWYWFGTFS